jgi:DNA mismatch repair ATPase MutS
MALAGAPVYAHRATHCPLLPVVSCLRVADSVRKGYSSFYAEVASVKTILDRAKEGTILFLIDEIFRGTNNRERLIGSYSVLQEVIKTDSYGFISTHDLELTQLAKNPEVGNWHFREDIVNNSMVFRYELLAGPCPTTNALKVMELVGLPIHQPNFVQT